VVQLKESDITKKILANLNARPGVFAYKNHKTRFGMNGIPDVEVMFVAPISGISKHVYIEVKRPGKKPTEIQKSMHAKIRHAGGSVIVATSLDEAILPLQSMGIPA